MAIHGIISALVVGLLIGALARLVLPGRQDLSLWLTVLIGAIGAILGTAFARALGVAGTGGIDWIEIGLQIAVAAAGILFVTGGRARRRIRR
jgi:uncharacterized membrane protein YeaQ/YmgE (transglycosylase-associated protein family)